MEPDLEQYEGPLPLFPLPSHSLLPHPEMPLHVFEPRYVQLVSDALTGRKLIGMVHLADQWQEEYFAAPRLRPVGCAGRITNLKRLPDGRYNLTLLGIRKFEILAETREDPYRAARIRWLVDRNEDATGRAADAAVTGLLGILERVATVRQEEAEASALVRPDLPFVAIVNRLVAASRLDPEEFVALLELRDVYARARRLGRILSARLQAHARALRYHPLLPEDPAVN